MKAKIQLFFKSVVSLTWYDVFLHFITNLITKSSGLLLTAGLVVSSANFLTDGSILQEYPSLSVAWAWTQSLAIDGSLGVSLYAVLRNLKQREWVKFALYTFLTILLTLVALFITEGDILSHAIDISTRDAMHMVGIDVTIFSVLRAVAVVGFVLMSRLEDVSLQHQSLSKQSPSTSTSEGETQQQWLAKETIEEMTQQLYMMLKQWISTEFVLQPAQHINSQVEDKEQINARLLQAYQELKSEGKRISARALARKANTHRSASISWLRAHQNTKVLEEDNTQD